MTERDQKTLGFERGATWAAFGALTENLRMAASRLGLRARVLTWPLDEVLSFTPDGPADLSSTS
ncbi:hypothetical protein [Streptosporangium lutulentum]|uniref:Uncharacterized protein n=1 Tax=Streptosporangium lutulentum TaxID=1461250 RepID=A0ABT9Q456_9ACTN|nr:hypothetical protein [Streptosporangium lutulentum]MDP9841517.1 hypothetical protein [Streptosporangium lutulentum]